MQPISRKLNTFRWMIILELLLLFFIPGWSASEESSVFNQTYQLKNQLKTDIVPDYYPYTFINKEGIPDGFSVDLIHAVTQVMGMDLEIRADTWERALKHLETGEIDLLPMMAYSEERDKIFDFSMPHTIAFDAVFTRTGDKKLKSAESLKDQTVIVMKGDQAYNFLRSSGLADSEHLILINSLPEALRLLSSGRGDAALMPKLVGLTLVNDLHLTNLTQSPVVIESYNRPFSFAVKKGNLLLLERLSQGLSIVKQTGQYREIYNKWFGALEPKASDLKSVLKYFFGILLVLLFIGFAFVLWSFSLRRQVISRTSKLENEIAVRKQADMRFRQVTDTIREVFWLVPLDWKEVYYISPAYEHVWGRTCEELYQKPMSWLESVIAEDYPKVKAFFSDGISTEPSEIVFPDFRIKRSDGCIAWISARIFFVLDDAGRPYRIAGIAEDITLRKQAEESLRESESFLYTLLNAIPLPVFYKNRNERYLGVNRAFESFVGKTREQLIGKTTLDVFPQELSEIYHTKDIELFERGGNQQYETQIMNALGALRHVIISKAVFTDRQGAIAGMIGTILDITERISLESQLRQSQKMESVGRLAGGVAHDFNNKLSVIIGHTDMIIEQTSPDQPFFADLQEILKAARHSADLTRQLLAFARKQTISPRLLDLNETVEGMLRMLRRLIGEDVSLAWLPGRGGCSVRMDPSQIDQILANLCVNARDAIAGVGKITIETHLVTFDEAYCLSHPEFTPGAYVMLSVSDNGCGMDKETRSKLFEPFFTTKEPGKGTGLGLSTVYGIVRQNNGFITVYSEPGHGTAFRIYFPRCAAELEYADNPILEVPTIARGDEIILLVEDETAVLDMVRLMLEGLGYQVLTASTPAEAIRVGQLHECRIDLLITDVIMPGMNGRELTHNLLSICPDVKRLFMSGYTSDIITSHGVLDEGANFIQKPFSLKELADQVRKVLDS